MREWRAGPCDLDPEVFNVAAAFVHPVTDRWMAPHHGVGQRSTLKACGCAVCMDAYEGWVAAEREAGPVRRPPPEPAPPRTVEIGPVRLLVVGLLDQMSRHELAAAAGIDATTISRLLRADVRRVSVTTAEALAAVAPVAPLNGRRHR